MEKNANVLKWILAIGIVVVLNLFFTYTIKMFYNEPQYDDFCKQEQINIFPENQRACIDVGGQWNGGAIDRAIKIDETSSSKGYCDTSFTCRKDYDDARKIYNRNAFIVLVVLGVVALVAGLFITVGSVSLGFALGGVLSFIIGAMRYWSDMEDYLRLIILALALVSLIWLGIKKLKG